MFVFPLSMSESPWSQQEFSWSKDGERKEKESYSFCCWGLPYVQSQTCILLQQNKKTSLSINCISCNHCCLCSLVVSVSYVLVFFKRLNTRWAFVYFDYHSLFHTSSLQAEFRLIILREWGILNWVWWKGLKNERCSTTFSALLQCVQILLKFSLKFCFSIWRIWIWLIVLVIVGHPKILALSQEMTVGFHRIWMQVESQTSPYLTVPCFSVWKVRMCKEILRDRPVGPLCKHPRMWWHPKHPAKFVLIFETYWNTLLYVYKKGTVSKISSWYNTYQTAPRHILDVSRYLSIAILIQATRQQTVT